MKPTEKISVVIPIRNEVKYIARTIRYLLEQDYPGDLAEILVVDGDSDDGAAILLKKQRSRAERPPRPSVREPVAP